MQLRQYTGEADEKVKMYTRRKKKRETKKKVETQYGQK
jgi:hypothetical protein